MKLFHFCKLGLSYRLMDELLYESFPATNNMLNDKKVVSNEICFFD